MPVSEPISSKLPASSKRLDALAHGQAPGLVLARDLVRAAHLARHRLASPQFLEFGLPAHPAPHTGLHNETRAVHPSRMDPNATLPRRDECVVGELLQRWARERPERNFLEFEDGSAWTFAQTLDRVQRAAGGLHALGVRQGAHVLCWMPNLREAVLGWLGANYLGAVHMPLNTGYRGRLLQHAIALSDAQVMLVHASLLPRLAEVDTAQLREVIVVGDEPPPSGSAALPRGRRAARLGGGPSPRVRSSPGTRTTSC